MIKGEVHAWHYATGEPVRLQWREGVITRIEKSADPAPRDAWVAPGLCDLQINGYGGIDFQQDDLTPDDLRDIGTAISQITVQGNRYTEEQERMTNI